MAIIKQLLWDIFNLPITLLVVISRCYSICIYMNVNISYTSINSTVSLLWSFIYGWRLCLTILSLVTINAPLKYNLLILLNTLCVPDLELQKQLK